MKILIVGGSSSVASALKERFISFSEVITIGRNNSDIVFDLDQPIDSIYVPDFIDVVIHTAAHFGGNSDKEISDAENINVIGTLKMCQLANKIKAKHFILISSIYSELDVNSEYYSIYSLSKKHSEEIAQYYCNKNSIPITILQFSSIYGPYDRLRVHQPFFYSMIDMAEKDQNIYLYGEHDPARNYIYIEDLVTITEKVVQNSVFGKYKCTNSLNVTYAQIAKTAFSIFGLNREAIFLKDKPNLRDNIFPFDDTLYKKIGYYPNTSLYAGILQIVNKNKSIELNK